MTSDEFCSTTYGYYGCAIPGSGGSTETKRQEPDGLPALVSKTRRPAGLASEAL